MPKYFYGASVAGIQSFIFQTGKLKEIAGASELVEQICTELFAEQMDITVEQIRDHEGVYQAAAGAVKCLFNTKEACHAFIRSFAKKVVYHAPGIQLTQAVIEITADKPSADDFEELEKKIRLSRNLPQLSVEPSAMVIQRSRRTGGASVHSRKNIDNPDVTDYFDKATLQKEETSKQNSRLMNKAFGREITEKERATDFSDLVNRRDNESWIAVIHADGNGLGKLIMKLQNCLKGEEFGEFMKQFSMKLDEATENAVQRAVTKRKLNAKDLIPIIIGGDDLTVIIRAEHALRFTEYFMAFFEEETKKHIGVLKEQFPNAPDEIKEGLTACAGIAFIKYNYPVHYGLTLSEALCHGAKEVSKQKEKHTKEQEKDIMPPSSLMFYKASSSFVESLKEIKDKELTPSYDKTTSFVAGPYFLHDKDAKNKDKPSLGQLYEDYRIYSQDGAPKSRLREWLGEMYYDKDVARQNLDRICSLYRRYEKSLRLNEGSAKLAGRIFDLELLSSVKHINDNNKQPKPETANATH